MSRALFIALGAGAAIIAAYGMGHRAGLESCPAHAASLEASRQAARDWLDARDQVPSDEQLVCAAILDEAETYLRARDRLDAFSAPE